MVRGSRRFCRLLQSALAGLYGTICKASFGLGREVAIHPDTCHEFWETFREALNSVKPFGVEGRPLRDRSGNVAKWYGTNTDIQQRKRAEVALRKSEERWRSVSENSAIGVAPTDYNGRFLATNHVFQVMVGYTEEELRAVNVSGLNA
jgi:PAS domain-containing protein